MTAKEFVKQHFPNARAERYKSNGPFPEIHYLIWSDFQLRQPKRLSEGKTESNAWVNAKKEIQSENGI